MEKVTENKQNQTFDHPIAKSIIPSGRKVIPLRGKIPLIENWEKGGVASNDLDQLTNWFIQFKNTEFGLPCGPENGIFVVDVDIEKDKEKSPIGPPKMGGITLAELATASFKQVTLSHYKGQKGEHYFFKYEDRLKIFSNKRLKPTTIDIRTRRGQVRIYRELPPAEIWEDLAPMPDSLFEKLKGLLNGKSKADWEVGDRNNTLFKKLTMDLKKNKGRNTPDIIDQAEKSGLGKNEIQKTSESAIKTALKEGIEPDPTPPQERSKGKTILPKDGLKKDKKPFARKLTGKIYKTHYNDDNKMCLRGFLGCVTGEKLAMKSSGMVSYLLENGNKIGYFSGGENTEEQLTAIQKVFEKEDDIIWLDLTRKGWPKEIAGAVKEYSLKTIFEDPPSDEWESQGIAREALSLRAQLAKELNVCWMFSRNFSKKKYDRLLSNVSGFGQMTNIPRFIIGAFPIEIGHKLRPEESSPKVSLLQTIACNEGPTPSHSIIAKVRVTSLEAENSERADIATCDIMKTPYIQDPQRYVLAPKSTVERDTTREFQALMLLKDKTEGLKRADLVAEIVKMFEVSEPTADRLKTELKEKGLIKGGGKDTKAPFKITEKGLKRLEGPKEKKEGGKKG